MYTQEVDSAGTTVLWRLFRATGENKDRMLGVILPGGPPFTLAFFANGDMDRVENYDSMELAVFRADEIRRGLIEEDWKED